ncbi:MAG: transcriptional repressor [Actinomycetota bacterium]|nr:transcriptional repressor [Actinomycetota bacterium]
MAALPAGPPPVGAPRSEMVAANVVARWRAMGRRCTPGKMALLRVLADHAPEHLSASTLCRLVNEAGWAAVISGVHKALSDFTTAGLTHTLHTAGPVSYGLAHPAHHHAICEGCGAVTEIPPDTLIAAIAAARRATDYLLLPGGLTLHGLCPACLD